MAARKSAGPGKSATRKSSTKGAKATAAKSASAPKSVPKSGKDPRGGLTAKGRAFFAKKEGSHLRPGVKGAADTPEKMMRKGSFLRRHFTHPRGPMVDDKGQPTRLALSAQAWGEPLPRTMAAAKKLAAKGHELLERYHATQDGSSTKKAHSRSRSAGGKLAKKRAAAGSGRARDSALQGSAKKGSVNKGSVKRGSAKKTGSRGARKTSNGTTAKRRKPASR